MTTGSAQQQSNKDEEQLFKTIFQAADSCGSDTGHLHRAGYT